ncbi:MAG: ABC transporter ATP-binding protein [Acidaminococcaceae bacterium]|nr:ABC transporter ATP-binding protein [Acidaminococcaceae bacterium]
MQQETVLQLQGLTIGYEAKTIISDINAEVQTGELIGIIGRNGAGKSTLLKTIRGLLPAKAGQVLYFGKSLASYGEKELARRVAYLQQNVETGFGYTGLDIVLTGRYPYMKWWESEKDEDKELARDCMSYTGTLDLAERPVTEVSGGQKQRILLAKVLAQQTPVLFLDEPTTGLDMVYREEIFRFARELANMGKTILMVVHELDLAAAYCSRIFLLGEGKLLADGTPEQVFTETLLSRAYEADISVEQNPKNGRLEITTKENPEAKKKELNLLQKICVDRANLQE